MLIRKAFSAAVAGLAMAAAASAAAAEPALDYLESLKGKAVPYIAPNDIDPRFTLAVYVNVATSGPNKQRMWVLERDAAGGAWRLALWDAAYWKKMKLAAGETPPFSWPVSSGRYYRGDRRSGPTPPGVYGLDERKGRYGRGWMQDGMIHVLHIDYHYGDGRISGVAFHGTTTGRYRRLGTADSHGCIRMHQTNALALLDRVTGRDKVLAEDRRWGEVPRFWRSENGRRRSGYVRDGSYLAELPPQEVAKAAGTSLSLVTEAEAADRSAADHGPEAASDAGGAAPPELPRLTKTGFRAIAVVFQD